MSAAACKTCDDFGVVEGVGKWYDAEVRFRPCPACDDSCRDWGRPVTAHYPRSEFHGAASLYWYHAAYLEAARTNRREALTLGALGGFALGVLVAVAIASVIIS